MDVATGPELAAGLELEARLPLRRSEQIEESCSYFLCKITGISIFKPIQCIIAHDEEKSITYLEWKNEVLFPGMFEGFAQKAKSRIIMVP